MSNWKLADYFLILNRITFILICLKLIYDYYKTLYPPKTYEDYLSSFPKLKDGSLVPPELLIENKNYLDEPSLYDSPDYSDYHYPIQYKNEKELQAAIDNTYIVPEKLSHILGGKRVISVYNKLLNEKLKEKNVLHSPLDFSFQRCQHPECLFNLIKTEKIQVLQIQSDSLLIRLKNICNYPIFFLYPLGSILDVPTNEHQVIISQEWSGIIFPGEEISHHLQWRFIYKEHSAPINDIKLTPFFLIEPNLITEEQCNKFQPVHQKTFLSGSLSSPFLNDPNKYIVSSLFNPSFCIDPSFTQKKSSSIFHVRYEVAQNEVEIGGCIGASLSIFSFSDIFLEKSIAGDINLGISLFDMGYVELSYNKEDGLSFGYGFCIDIYDIFNIIDIEKIFEYITMKLLRKTFEFNILDLVYASPFIAKDLWRKDLLEK